MGIPLAWPVSEAWIKTHNALDIAGGSLWRKQMSVCGHKRVPVEHVILFLSSGDFVSEVWVLWNALGGVPIRVSVSDTRWHTRLMRWAKSTGALFSREWSAFTVSLFLWEKLRSRSSLFSRELGRSSAPRGSGPATAEAVKRLSSRQLQMESRNYRWKQEVLCWIMVGRWRRIGYFWAFSAFLPRDVELLEVMKRALLLGRPTVEARKRGSGSQ